MKSQVLSGVAVLVSGLALGLVLTKEPGERVEVADGPDVAGLEERLARLEERLSDGVAMKGLAREGEVTGLAGKEGIARVEERQRRLEERLEKFGIFERFEEHEALVAASYAKVLNAELPAKERFAALGLLNEEGRIDGAVVESMMDLWEGTAEEGKMGDYYRWTMMENLRGTDHPRFRDNVLSMLQEEPGAKMTGQAISALEPMLPDPAVEEWLTHLSGNAGDAKIQEYAAGALERGRAQGE